MSAPTGSDTSTDTDGSPLEAPADAETAETDGAAGLPLDDPRDLADATGSLAGRAADWARHWRAWGLALCSLLVVGWAVVQPAVSPKGYIPICFGFAAIAVGYVYLDEESQVRLASG
jgi:hypothetical protein